MITEAKVTLVLGCSLCKVFGTNGRLLILPSFVLVTLGFPTKWKTSLADQSDEEMEDQIN